MTDLQAKRELAYEAKEIIESKAFEQAKADMREALVNELMTVKDRERRDDIIAELKVLEGALGRFKALINDYNAGVREARRGSVPFQGRGASRA